MCKNIGKLYKWDNPNGPKEILMFIKTKEVKKKKSGNFEIRYRFLRANGEMMTFVVLAFGPKVNRKQIRETPELWSHDLEKIG